MLTSDRVRSVLFCLCCLSGSGGFLSSAYALDASQPVTVPAPVLSGSFRNVSEAFTVGMNQYNNGEKGLAVKALEYAATHGHAMAEWKLGRMYAEGDGVNANKLKAFVHFSKICNDFADEAPDSPNARFVANAFVSLGTIYLEGVPNTAITPNPQRAREAFAYAATWFGDPDAQYSLGRLTLEGVGGSQDAKQALRWFNLSAEKGHVQSQAMLGSMLYSGEGGMLQRARGLMWLQIARNSAKAEADQWIIALHDQAFNGAADTDRLAALSYIEQYKRHKR